MCKIPDLKVAIKDLGFATKGPFTVSLTDGWKVIEPIGLFPDIKKLSKKQRSVWMMLSHQYFAFEHMPRIYSILDVVNVVKSA